MSAAVIALGCMCVFFFVAWRRAVTLTEHLHREFVIFGRDQMQRALADQQDMRMLRRHLSDARYELEKERQRERSHP